MVYFYNPNPTKSKDANDCVIRAFAFFFGISWEDAFLDLVKWCISKGLVRFNYRSVYTQYLLDKGFKKKKAPSKGLTIGDFCANYAHSRKVYIVSLPRHLSIVFDQDIFDIFDCSNMVMDGYWAKQ